MFSLLVTMALALPSNTGHQAAQLHWVHDDWAKAKSQAKKEGKLVAVDVWATWCHTCLAMKNYALKSKEVASVANQHIWLEMDYDRPQNAAFFKAYPINAFPTFMVIDPRNDKVVARWLGSGSAQDMKKFFSEARAKSTNDLDLGQQALSSQNYPLALKHFAKALKNTKDKNRKTRILSGYIEALWKTDKTRCATEGLQYIDETEDSVQGLDYAMMINWCASGVEDKKLQQSIFQKIKARLERGLKNPKLSLSADEKSSVYATLAGLYESAGDKQKAQATMKTRLSVLEAAAKAAPTPAARSTFDAHRVSCYLKLNQHKKAEAMLLQTEKDLPKDFNTPWRLARLYQDQKRYKDGLAAIDRALQNGYGPRRIRLYSAKIDLAVAKKDFDLARKAATKAHKEIEQGDRKLIREYWLKELSEKEALIPKK